MHSRRTQTLNLSIIGVVLLLVASVGAVWLQPDPVEAASGPIHIDAPAEMAEAFASILPRPAIAAAVPPGAAGMGLGGYMGAKFAVEGGEKVIRPVLVISVLALAGRMIGLY